MRHHTTNPGERAFSIALQTADREYEQKGDPAQYFRSIEEVYHQTLKEIVYGTIFKTGTIVPEKFDGECNVRHPLSRTAYRMPAADQQAGEA